MPGPTCATVLRCSISRKPCTHLHRAAAARRHWLTAGSRVQGLVGDVDAWLSAGEGVYLHCWGGRGRAGTMAACVLISLYGLSSQQALKHIQAAYDTRAGGKWCGC